MPFTTIAQARQFILAGNARVTLVSKKSGARFTYRVRRPSPDKPWFVSVLTGSDNESDYSFLGTVFGDGHFKLSAKSKIGASAPSAVAWAWFAKVLVHPMPNLPDSIEVHHEGRCGRCGQALTVPESIESGFGPECINHVH